MCSVSHSWGLVLGEPNIHLAAFSLKKKEKREIPKGKKFQLSISIFHFTLSVLEHPSQALPRSRRGQDLRLALHGYWLWEAVNERRFVLLESSLCSAIELLRKLQCVFFPTKRLGHDAPDTKWILGKWREPDWVRMLAAKPLSLVLGGTGQRLAPVERAQSDDPVWFFPATNKVSFMAHNAWCLVGGPAARTRARRILSFCFGLGSVLLASLAVIPAHPRPCPAPAPLLAAFASLFSFLLFFSLSCFLHFSSFFYSLVLFSFTLSFSIFCLPSSAASLPSPHFVSPSLSIIKCRSPV